MINTLQQGMTYLIMDKGKGSLTLGCQAASDVHKVYWYVNDRYYGAADAGKQLFYTPGAGVLKVSCTDDKGRVADVEVKVKVL